MHILMLSIGDVFIEYSLKNIGDVFTAYPLTDDYDKQLNSNLCIIKYAPLLNPDWENITATLLWPFLYATLFEWI